jgi:phosphodiesterase/alkaline phosphatase D-like protein
VILWTRVTVAPSTKPTLVSYVVATDPGLRNVVVRGSARTGPEADYTVKVDAGAVLAVLHPNTTYYYQFTAGGQQSPIGRTKTLPLGSVGSLRFAVVSCSNHAYGYFNAYARIAARADLDLVMHLGDYIYEYGAAPNDYGMNTGAPLGRSPLPPHEIVSLADYRTRHAQYKTDPDLQAAHARAAFICVWDDHEVANDTWATGAENHTDATEGPFTARKAAALVVRTGDNQVLFARQLAAGEAWRAPMGVNATLDVSDPTAFDVYLNGELGGNLPAVLTPLSQLNSRAATLARQTAAQVQAEAAAAQAAAARAASARVTPG